jgi:farnesyl diphosphate synthase
MYICDLQLQAHFLVMDDIMDGSVTRRGRPCWYLYENLGTAAVNDGLLLENGVYQLLSRYFRDKPYYVHVLELFHDVSLIFILKIRVNLIICLGVTSRDGIEKEVQ